MICVLSYLSLRVKRSNDKRECGAAWQYFLELSDHPAAARHPSNGGELGVVLFVIAREHSDRGDPVIIKSHAFACAHYLLDCFVSLAMTEAWWSVPGEMHSLTTPPLRGTPP